MIERWFSTPIYYSMVRDISTIQNELKPAVENSNFTKHSEWGNTNHSLTDPTFTESIIDQYNMINMKNEIQFHVSEYIAMMKPNFKTHSVVFEESWLTNTAPGEYTTAHQHGGHDISGVYYYQTNGKDGKIYFMNPVLSLTNDNWNDTDDLIYYPPAVGKIILFPSWLYHGVRSNDTDEHRISFSFNLKLKEI